MNAYTAVSQVAHNGRRTFKVVARVILPESSAGLLKPSIDSRADRRCGAKALNESLHPPVPERWKMFLIKSEHSPLLDRHSAFGNRFAYCTPHHVGVGEGTIDQVPKVLTYRRLS